MSEVVVGHRIQAKGGTATVRFVGEVPGTEGACDLCWPGAVCESGRRRAANNKQNELLLRFLALCCRVVVRGGVGRCNSRKTRWSARWYPVLYVRAETTTALCTRERVRGHGGWPALLHGLTSVSLCPVVLQSAGADSRVVCAAESGGAVYQRRDCCRAEIWVSRASLPPGRALAARRLLRECLTLAHAAHATARSAGPNWPRKT